MTENKLNREPTDNNKVLQIDLSSGEVVNTWDSPYKASEAVNHSCKRIKMTCRGLSSKAGGFGWAYESKELQNQYNVTPDSYKKV